ncbi:MAG: hypothetical protein JWM20_392 [Patescibacteria group bacterium]|nr:hypothetical protein [Patescibacteria group bacterium]
MKTNKKILSVIGVLVIILAAACVALALNNRHQSAPLSQNQQVADEAVSSAIAAHDTATKPQPVSKKSVAKPTKSVAMQLAERSPSFLDGTSYQLASIDGHSVSPGASYVVGFKDGRINAKFCNSMGGAFTLANGVIKANLVSTMMACQSPADSMQSESSFGKLLGNGAKLTMEGNSLVLAGNDGTVMSFVRIFAQ